jgi:prolyl oligopeptidase
MSLSLLWAQSNVPPPLPPTPKQPVTDEYHGVKVTDDYRWLEDGKDPKVQAWTAAENTHARTLLNSLPIHDEIYNFIKKLDAASSPAYWGLKVRHGVIFAYTWEPTKQQPMLVTLKSANDPTSKHIVLDPSKIDATNSTAIQFYDPSPDGSKVVVSLAAGGSEAGTLRIYDVESGNALPDTLTHVSGNGGVSAAWSADGNSIYYTRYPREGERPPADMNFYEQLYLHKLGTPQDQDTYVLGKNLPRIAEISLHENNDATYLLAAVQNGDGGIFEHFLRDPSGDWKQLSQFSDEIITGSFGPDSLFFLSRHKAPRGKVLRMRLADPDLARATTIIPESSAVIQDFPSIVATDHDLYVGELVGGPNEVHIFDQDGKEKGAIPSQPVSAVDHFVATQQGDELLFSNESYTSPAAWFYYDATTKKASVSALRRNSPVNFADIEAVREFAISKEGTRIPFTVLQRKGIKLDGNNPAVLTGYGGFNISQTPEFDPGLAAWLDAGGVFAIANLRGGGEFGEEWHNAGRGVHKQNVFDDFIACAERLIQLKYTNPSKLGILGGSNGGLLMGAAFTQRPDLFRAVVTVAGIYDMLRLETTENGQFNVTEYGSIKNPEQFKALYAYSPYHHVQDGTKYPAILFMTGENDPRVDPWHSRKMVARLQAANASDRPILLVSFANAGHGGIGSSEDQQSAMTTYQFEFFYEQLGVKWVNPEVK